MSETPDTPSTEAHEHTVIDCALIRHVRSEHYADEACNGPIMDRINGYCHDVADSLNRRPMRPDTPSTEALENDIRELAGANPGELARRLAERGWVRQEAADTSGLLEADLLADAVLTWRSGSVVEALAHKYRAARRAALEGATERPLDVDERNTYPACRIDPRCYWKDGHDGPCASPTTTTPETEG